MANNTTRTFGTAIARKKRKTVSPRSSGMDTTNAAGHGAFTRPADEEYLKILLSNVFGETFYTSAQENYSDAVAAHENMVKKDPEFVSKALPFARNRGYMRSQPTLGLAMLAIEEGKNPSKGTIAEVEKRLALVDVNISAHRQVMSDAMKIVDVKTYYEARQDLKDAYKANNTKDLPAIRERIAKTTSVTDKTAFEKARKSLGQDYNERNELLKQLGKAVPAHFERAFDGVINIPNDIMDFATIIKSQGHGEAGRMVKRVAGAWLRDHLDEFWAIKYGADKEGGYALRDLIRTYHPTGAKSEVVKYLLDDPKNPADLSKLPKIKAFEDLKKATTYTEKSDAIKAGQLPHEVVTPFIGNDSELWEVLGAQMPVFAFLRNLATLERHKVLDKPAVRDHAEKLFTQASIEKSKILPFRFIEAEKHVSASWMKKLLEKAVDYAFASIPDIEGRTAIFLDRSGSMGGGAGSYMQIGSLYAVCLMKKLKGDGRFLLYDTELEEKNVSLTASIMPQVNAIKSRGGTATSLPMQKLLTDKDKVANIILISDEQQNSGSAFVNIFDKYRATVAPDVKLFIINVASYHGGLMPKGDKNVYYIFGWSDKVLQFISLASIGFDSMAQAIRDGAFK